MQPHYNGKSFSSHQQQQIDHSMYHQPHLSPRPMSTASASSSTSGHHPSAVIWSQPQVPDHAGYPGVIDPAYQSQNGRQRGSISTTTTHSPGVPAGEFGMLNTALSSSSSSGGYSSMNPLGVALAGSPSTSIPGAVVNVADEALGQGKLLYGYAQKLRTYFRTSLRGQGGQGGSQQPHQEVVLLKVLDVFCGNLAGHVNRLIAREMELTGKESKALASIARDFDKASAWLSANESNFTSNWPLPRITKALHDLDERLTKAFTSKLAVALFEAVQDNRQISLNISRQIEQLSGDLNGVIKRIVKEAGSRQIGETIERLRAEELAVRPGGSGRPGEGYENGEAEKTIQALIDALTSAQSDTLQREEREAAAEALGLAPPSTTKANSIAPPQLPHSNTSPHLHQQQQFQNSDNQSLRSTHSVSSFPFTEPIQVDSSGAGAFGGKVVGSEGIVFHPTDPISKLELIDPVLGSDGYIHDRWTLINQKPENQLIPGETLRVVGDVVQLRGAMFSRFPERKEEFLDRRGEFLVAAVQACDSMAFVDIVDVHSRLSDILLWMNGEEDVGLLVRRGLLRWKLRLLRGAKADFLRALDHQPGLPIHHLLAMVYIEQRAYTTALSYISQSLAKDPENILALALRSIVYFSTDSKENGAQDLERAVRCAFNEDAKRPTMAQSYSGEKKNRNMITGDWTPLPKLEDLNYLFIGFAYMSSYDVLKATTFLEKAISLGSAGDAWPRALLAFCLTQSSTGKALEEGFTELEACWKLSGDVGRAVYDSMKDEEFGKWYEDEKKWSNCSVGGAMVGDNPMPLRAGIGFLLSQSLSTTLNPPKERCLSLFLTSLNSQHPSIKTSYLQHSFLADLYHKVGKFDDASREFDLAVAHASSEGKIEDRAGILAERGRLRL